jgi:hypothetical protein
MPDNKTCSQCVFYATSEFGGAVGKCLCCMDEAQYIILASASADDCPNYSDKDSIDNMPNGGE